MKNSILNGNSLLYGIICAISYIACMAFFGTPLEMIHIIRGINILPPIWLFNLLSVFWFFLIGVAAGAIAGSTGRKLNTGKSEIYSYKGGLFFLICFFTSLIRYYLLFFAGKLFMSLIISIICLVCSFLCTSLWIYANPKISSVIMFLFSIWQIYLFFVNLSIFLLN